MKTKHWLVRSLTGIGVAGLALAILTSPTTAADKKSEAGSAPDMEAMMKKMEELSTPGAEHQILKSLAGEWETEAKCYMAGPEGEPTITSGTAKGKMILGGRFLQEEFEGDMMGKRFHGVGLTGYDKFNKKFVTMWIDDMGTGIFTAEGTSDGSGKVLTFTGKMDDPMTGEKQKPVKLITKIVSPNKHTFEMHDLNLGEKTKVMEITYVRKGESSLTSR